MSDSAFKPDFDLVIAGAGPAGCTLALKLAGKGLRIGIVEKDTYPRDKICGDALSGKVLNVLKRLPDGIYSDFLRSVEKTPSFGIRFIAPNHHVLDVPFSREPSISADPPGYVCKRRDFDQFLFNKLKDYGDVTILESETVTALVEMKDHVRLITRSREFSSTMIAGADGVHSVVRKHLAEPASDLRNHLCLGIRGYFKNVSGIHPENYIELIFLKKILPGYFWIFPSTDGMVNAGIGILQSVAIKQKESLIRVFSDLMRKHPLLAPRFAESTMVGKPEAHTLPLGSLKMKRSGNRFLLLGDAAFLVDPFSGEGIGNAMASGEVAAEVILNSFTNNDFSAKILAGYDLRLQKRFGNEFKTSAIMQKLVNYPWLMNFVVDKAIRNKNIRDLLTDMYTNEDLRKKLTRPDFYTGLLFR